MCPGVRALDQRSRSPSIVGRRSARNAALPARATVSRLVPIVELVLTGLLVYALASRLGGRAGGTFAAALWLLNPFVLGIGHLDGIDIPFTLVTLAMALAVLRG